MEKQLIPQLRFPEFNYIWESKPFKELTKINQGLQIPISERYLEQVEDSYFYITNEFLKVGSKNTYFIKNPSKSVLCTKDDILMTRTGNTGMVVTNVSGAFHNNFFKIAYPESINKSFLYYFLTLNNTQNYIKRLAGTSTIPDLNHSDFYKIKFNFPKLPEQQKIASFLSDVDAKITQLTKKKELLEQYKKGIMQKIFSQELRFKDDNGNEFPDWEIKKLGNVFSSFKGKGIPKGDVITDGNYKCVLYGELYTTYNEVINKVVSSTNSEDGLRSKKGDLLIPSSTTTTGIDLANVTALNFENILLGGDIIVMRGKKEINNVFYAYYLSNFKKYQIASRAQGITIVHIYFNSIKDLEIDVPVVEEQTKIANFLSDIDAKMEALNTQIENSKTFKKGLLQKMFV